LYFLFFLLFGISPSFKQALDTHYYIILSILTNNISLFIYALLCMLYLLKCTLFYGNHIRKNEYQFLQLLNGMETGRRLAVFLPMTITLLAPLILYTGCVVGVAIKNHLFFNMVIPVALMFLLILICVLIIRFLNKNADSFALMPTLRLSKQPVAIWWFLLKFSFREQFWTLIILKILSFCCLYFFVITDSSIFENRILWLLITLCLVAHSVLIYKNFYFLENKLSFYRSLPIHPIKILISIFFYYVLLLIPEYWALRGVALLHHNSYEYFCILLAAPAILTLIHCLLYGDDLNMEGFLGLVFLLWIVFFFFGFTHTKWLVPVVAIAGCLIVFLLSFKGFEKNASIEKLE